MHEKCQICGIVTDSAEVQQQGILFHHFPVSRPDICRQWLEIVGKPWLQQLPSERLKNRTICSRHFRHSSYPGPLSKMLYRDAVPDRNCCRGQNQNHTMIRIHAGIHRWSWLGVCAVFIILSSSSRRADRLWVSNQKTCTWRAEHVLGHSWY
ncbi:uncharacterized protein [Anabrus simplex]|uniref:uncharacterized protein n=1 Tax=Anabrus simplex TaxID=316456 RepID=UPI0035A27EE3